MTVSVGIPSARAAGPPWTIRRRSTVVQAGETPALPGGACAAADDCYGRRDGRHDPDGRGTVLGARIETE